MVPPMVRHRYVLAKARMLHRELALPGPPVDIEAVIWEHKIWLSYAFAENLDAMAFMHDEKYYIVIHPFSPERDRWSMAHEFGHIYLGHFGFETENGNGSEQLSVFSRNEHRILDREANIFARELLLPAKWVKAAAGDRINKSTIRRVRERFDVSWEAAIIRLDELGIMPRDEAERWLSGEPDF